MCLRCMGMYYYRLLCPQNSPGQNTGEFHSPEDLSNPEIKPMSSNFQMASLPSEPSSESEVKSLGRVQLFATPWTVAYQAPLSMGFSRPEYWSGLPFPSPPHHQRRPLS